MDDRHPIDVLTREHRVILAVLASMEREAARTAAGSELRRRFWLECARFAEQFADARHHAKEEDLLFPILAAADLATGGGPVQVMRAEHDDLRQMVRDLRAAAHDRPADAVLRAARGYVHALREHIAKEDEVLFVMAREVLAPDEEEALRKGFAEVEAVCAAEGGDRILDLAATLCADLGVPMPAR